MQKSKYLYVFISLFFLLLFAMNASAYQIFSANPYFNNSINTTPLGVVLYNSAYNNSFYQNATCDGLVNCLIISNNGSAQYNSLWFQGYDWFYANQNPQWSDLNSLQNFSADNEQNDVPYLYALLPANKEGLLIFNYQFNNSITTPAPHLSILDSLGNSVLFLTLNSTPNVWNNVSQIINASAADRYLTLRLSWYWDNNVARLEMDKFKFYTYDISESSDIWMDLDTERIKYCGNDSSFTTWSPGNLYPYSMPDSAYYAYDNPTSNNGSVDGVGMNTPANTGWLLADGEDGFECDVFRLGHITIARRTLSTDINQGMTNSFNAFVVKKYRDFYLIDNDYTYNPYGNVIMTYDRTLLFSNSLLSAKYYTLWTSNESTQMKMNTNGYNIYYNLTNESYGGAWQYLSINNSLTTVNLLGYSNTLTPAGTTWNITHINGVQSSNYPFFDSSYILSNACTPHSTYNPATNNQSYINADCSETNQVYCGTCGGNSNGTACNTPSIVGTVCTPDATGWTNNYYSCTTGNTGGSCPSGDRCEQLTPKLVPNPAQIIENFTSCQFSWWQFCVNIYNCQCDITNTADYCINKCGADLMPVFSNCPDACRPYAISHGQRNYQLVHNYYSPNPAPYINAYTACCINSNGYADYCIDQWGDSNQTGTQILNNWTNGTSGNITQPCTNTSSVCFDSFCNSAPCPPPDITTNAFGWISKQFGSLFDMGADSSLPYSEAGFSIVLSLLAGLGIMIYEHDKSEHGGTFANISFLAVFLLCAIMSANAILYGLFAVVVIIDVGMITGMLKKLIGGG